MHYHITSPALPTPRGVGQHFNSRRSPSLAARPRRRRSHYNANRNIADGHAHSITHRPQPRHPRHRRRPGQQHHTPHTTTNSNAGHTSNADRDIADGHPCQHHHNCMFPVLPTLRLIYIPRSPPVPTSRLHPIHPHSDEWSTQNYCGADGSTNVFVCLFSSAKLLLRSRSRRQRAFAHTHTHTCTAQRFRRQKPLSSGLCLGRSESCNDQSEGSVTVIL
jgi:hypothetical protein